MLSILLTAMTVWAVLHQQLTLARWTGTVTQISLLPFSLLPNQFIPIFATWESSIKLLTHTQETVQLVQQAQTQFEQNSTLTTIQRTALLNIVKKNKEQFVELERSLNHSFILKKLLPKQTESAKEYVTLAKLASELGEVLLTKYEELTSGQRDRNYLVLFQNDRELRPTGGFLGSYAHIKFNQGQLSHFEVQDIYVPDGQLPGHVEPPQPIQDAFQQGFWRLRDANWHPDVLHASENINWFFDTGTNQKIDGNIFITYHAIETILTEVGPIYLPDYQQTVTAEQLYTFLQSEVEEDFFPGSTKKKDVLSAVTHQFFIQLQKAPIEKKLRVALLIKQLLDEKFIIASLSQTEVHDFFEKNNWTGKLVNTLCNQSDCFDDYFSIYDANLGVNKANCCIKRTVQLEKHPNLDNSKLLTYTNLHYTFTEIPETHQQFTGDYKSFTRLYVPAGSELEHITVNGVQYEQMMTRWIAQRVFFPTTQTSPTIDSVNGMKEFGLWIYVPKAEETHIEIITSTPLFTTEQYQLTLQKQPGTHNSYNNWRVSLGEKILFNEVLKKDKVISTNNL